MPKECRIFHLEGPQGIHFIAEIMEWVWCAEENPSQMSLHVYSPAALNCSLALYSPLLPCPSSPVKRRQAGHFWPSKWTVSLGPSILVSQLISASAPFRTSIPCPGYECPFQLLLWVGRNSTCKDLQIATSFLAALQSAYLACNPLPTSWGISPKSRRWAVRT